MIKAVLFDIDGVLIDSLNANTHFFQKLLSTAGYPPPSPEEYKTMFHLPIVDVLRKVTGTNSEAEIQRIQSLVGNQVPYPVELVKPQPNVEQVIENLRQKYQLGLITSRIKNHVWRLPLLNKCKDSFTILISLDDVKKPKPDPEGILIALKKLNVEPNEAVYLGDAITDFQAGKAAGVQTVMFKNTEVEGVDGYVSSLTEFEEWLANR